MPGPKLITELPEVVGFTNSHLIAVGDPNTGTLYKTTIDFITVGPQGNQGSIGATGIQGNIGLQGSQGFQGRQGNFGATGFQGLQGNQGWQGFQGLQGLQGRQGSGVTGSQGWQGSQGNIGNQGDVGERGFQGNDGLNPTNNYKVYRALISQVGTDDPTVVVLENTLGEDLIFTRIEPGLYDVTSTLEQFKIDKTFLYIGPLNDGDYSSISGLTAMRNYNDSTLKIVAQQNFTERIYGDGLLSNTPLEILIYN